MTTATTAPADTRMMGIVHAALLRDLSRTTVVLTGDDEVGDARRAAITAHLTWMLDLLHRHHVGEDVALWPLMRTLEPSAVDLLDQMERDHAEIAPQIDALRTATDAYAADGGAAARGVLVSALAGLRAVLDPHLHREETEMMPIVSRTLTQEQWEAFNYEQYLKTKTKSELGREGHWLIDSIDPAGYQLVVGTVPAVPRFILLHAFGRPYARGCALRWGSDVRVKPLAS